MGAVGWTFLAVTLLAQPSPAETPAAAGAAASQKNVVAAILQRFDAPRRPPFVSYTLRRSQLSVGGYADVANSYAKHVWVRSSDGAAMSRLVFGDGERGPMTFDRPAFNEARDPGPPTADLLAGLTAAADSAYNLDAIEVLGALVHVRLTPRRDPSRNRLREIIADARTSEIRQLVAADTLFIERGPTYPVTLTITMGSVEGVPVVRTVHGVVGGNYNDDGKEVDFDFTDVAFPAALPDWYFDPRSYGAHAREAPR